VCLIESEPLSATSKMNMRGGSDESPCFFVAVGSVLRRSSRDTTDNPIDVESRVNLDVVKLHLPYWRHQ